MTGLYECCHKANRAERGNAIVIALVVVAIVAAGVLAFLSGKMDGVLPKKAEQVAENVADKAEEAIKSAESEMTPEQLEEQNKKVVVAKVNDEKISRQDVIDFMNAMPAQMRQVPPEKLFPMALEQIINNKVVDKKAEGADLENDPQIQKQLDLVKSQIIRAQFIENKVEEKMTEERLKEEYQEYLANFPEIQEMNAAHILVEDEKTANEVIEKLNKGEDFAELAKEYSKDGSGEGGGDLGYFAKTEVVAEFAEAAFALEEGVYTKEPVKSDFGYHVIKAAEKRTRPPADYEQVKPYLQQELRREILQEVIAGLKDEYKIQRYDVNGNPITDKNPEEKEPAAGEATESTAPATEAEEAAE